MFFSQTKPYGSSQPDQRPRRVSRENPWAAEEKRSAVIRRARPLRRIV